MSNVLKITHNGKAFLVGRVQSNLTTVNDLYLSKTQRENILLKITVSKKTNKQKKQNTRMIFSRVTEGY